MSDMIFFDNGKKSVIDFFQKEFENLPALISSHFLNQFNDILNYTEEGAKFKPKLIFTDSIEMIIKAIPKSYALTIFEDADATKFNLRLKAILAIAKNQWCVFIDVKENKITYGIVMSFRSIKDRSFLRMLEDNLSLKDKQPKIHCVIVRPISFFSMELHSISGNDLMVNLSLDETKSNSFASAINMFVDCSFSKLRTTQRKLQDLKNMYINIFSNVMNDVNGAICVIVDKEYIDTGLFEDGIWLKDPISFSKMFSQSKSYSEEKLQAYADLFVNMLNFDGITIIDNQGKIRAYNVFVEPNSKKVGYVVGGARKRAAYYILNSRRKGIVGVYFQSHEGEVFFQEVKHKEKTAAAKPAKPPEPKQLVLAQIKRIAIEAKLPEEQTDNLTTGAQGEQANTQQSTNEQKDTEQKENEQKDAERTENSKNENEQKKVEVEIPFVQLQLEF